MWTLTGAFDGLISGETNFEKVKLAKPGKEYIVGRKDCPLIVNDRKVSRKHQVLIVGKYSAQDVENPDVVPSLDLYNIAVNRWVERDGQKLIINAGASMSLQSGDKVEVLHDVPISVKWEKIVCYCPLSRESTIPSMEECAKLGINITWKLHYSVTHHITSELTLDPAVAVSLLSLTKFVTPDWLQTIVTRGSSSDPSLSLEHEFILPSISQHRPALSSSLPSGLQSYRSWEPNEARVNLFKLFRFVFVGERGREVAEEYIELVRRGGASYSCCAVQGGQKALHNALAKGKEMGSELVLVANIDAMVAAIGQDEWQDLVKEAAQFELTFIGHIKLVEAVAHIDLSYVRCHMLIGKEIAGTESGRSGLLDSQPSSSSAVDQQEVVRKETEAPPPPRRKLVRRAGSRAPSMPPPEVPQSMVSCSSVPSAILNGEASAAPRRRLVRRTGITKPTIVGVDDPSIIEDPPINFSNRTPVDLPPATQSRPNRLKRRTDVTQPQESQLFAAIDASLTVVEPPHKKYKALFEESDPDRIIYSSAQSNGSIMQAETSYFQASIQPPTPSAPPLAAVAEEGEESFNPSVVSGQPTSTEMSQLLRRAPMGTNGDAEMEDAGQPYIVTDAGSSGSHTASTDSQVPPQPPSSRPFTSTLVNVNKERKTGSAPNKPDRDEAFLKAVASTKRGKRHEDDFDREFNDLRISKPDLERERVQEDWSVLNDFGDDSGLRGNFMVVVEMDVFRKDDSARDVMRTAGGRADWEGRANFKKFKKKVIGERQNPVELIVEGEDGGLSQEPLKVTLSQSKPQSQVYHPERHRTESPRKKTGLVVDSDEEMPTPKRPGRKPPSTQSQHVPKVRARIAKKAQGSSYSQKKANPLFLKSDEDEVAAEEECVDPLVDGDSDLEATLTTTGRRTQPTRMNAKKRSAPALIVDDSDDGATFQGFGARKKARR
ncbi:hypothetical protein BDY19DRAFT_973975 [Irpex rosettiformis]|uniref:Uncharacterized protein n=1 Tax=Irpex rosettiformis TaxID=378272 RepID=A0ACB8TQ26_9APHY|nr:hypothetical protein BDY19DRAFT_973975 [Irpex rosettiformis]